jgi:hypothetical protein
MPRVPIRETTRTRHIELRGDHPGARAMLSESPCEKHPSKGHTSLGSGEKKMPEERGAVHPHFSGI